MQIRKAVCKSILTTLGFERACEVPTELRDDHTLLELGLDDDLDRLEIIEDVEEVLGVDIFELDVIMAKGDDLTVGDIITAIEEQS